jgi:hypothetical protein
MNEVCVVLFNNRSAKSESQSLNLGNSQHSPVSVPGTFLTPLISSPLQKMVAVVMLQLFSDEPYDNNSARNTSGTSYSSAIIAVSQLSKVITHTVPI